MPEDEEVVILRDVLPEDLPILFEYQRQPAANAMAAFPARDWDTFVAHWAKISKDENAITRAVVLQGEVAGTSGAGSRTGDARSATGSGWSIGGRVLPRRRCQPCCVGRDTPSLRARGEAQRGLTPRLAEVRVQDRQGGAPGRARSAAMSRSSC